MNTNSLSDTNTVTDSEAKIIPIFNKEKRHSEDDFTLYDTYNPSSLAIQEEIPNDLLLTQNKFSTESKNRISSQALKIFRTHFSKEIITQLDWLAKNHNIDETSSIPAISILLNLIKEYFEKYSEDPFSSFLVALYDGLTENHSYLSIERDKYNKILGLVKTMNNQSLDFKKIDKCIFKLEELGLNTLPY